jgi:hypothetical protein
MTKLKTFKEAFIEKLKTNTAIPENEFKRILELLDIFEKEALPKDMWDRLMMSEIDTYGFFWFGHGNKLYKNRLEWFETLYKFYMERLEREKMEKEEKCQARKLAKEKKKTKNE